MNSEQDETLRCPECGAVVEDYFAHVDSPCPPDSAVEPANGSTIDGPTDEQVEAAVREARRKRRLARVHVDGKPA